MKEEEYFNLENLSIEDKPIDFEYLNRKKLWKQDQYLFKKINLDDLGYILDLHNIKYDKHSDHIIFGLNDNIVYFYNNRYNLYDGKNYNSIIHYLAYLNNLIQKKNENIVLNNNYINNQNNFIVLNDDNYYSSSDIKSFSAL